MFFDKQTNKQRVPNRNYKLHFPIVGHAVAQLVEAQRYKPEGRGFDSRWVHWNFLLI
jgi:hypothetical protein